MIILLLTIQFVPLLVQLHWNQKYYMIIIYIRTQENYKNLNFSYVYTVYPLDVYTRISYIVVSINTIIIPCYIKKFIIPALYRVRHGLPLKTSIVILTKTTEEKCPCAQEDMYCTRIFLTCGECLVKQEYCVRVWWTIIFIFIWFQIK